jgi:hypothetical protein
MSKNFIENPIGFRKTNEMDDLLDSCPKKTTLRSSGLPARSIAGCVSDMIKMDQGRVELSEKRRQDWFAEQSRLAQEEQRKKHAIQEFRGGIASIKVDVSQTQKRRCILDEFASGGGAMMKDEFDETETRKRGRKLDEFDETETRKRGRKLDEFEFEDACSFLEFE